MMSPPPREAMRIHPKDSPVELALLDRRGVIVAVNQAWLAFSDANGGDPARNGPGVSYLEICDRAGDATSVGVAAGIRTALSGELPAPLMVTIPCDAPDIPRRFDVLISSRFDDGGDCVGATVSLSRSAVPDGDLMVRIEEQERIAARLNEEVISGLFSVSLGLQSFVGQLRHGGDQARIARYIDALDLIISSIRHLVFETEPVISEGCGLKHRLVEVLDQSGLRPSATTIEFAGPLDTGLHPELADVIVEVMKEALANIARPSRVGSVHVLVAGTDSQVAVEVAEDRAGHGDVLPHFALQRLNRLAAQAGGKLEVTSLPVGGTVLRWTAPIGSDETD